MGRKIGEIFEYNGEWYQCVEDTGCGKCDLRNIICRRDTSIFPFKECSGNFRTDKKPVIFRKLEKVGETYEKRVSDGTFSTFQKYKLYNSVILPKKPYMYCNFIDNTIEIEIKQNKEDMGDNADIRPYDELFSPGTVSNTKHLAKEDMEEKKLNLKPFDIQKAREGKPVCTRDGRKARIICFDRRGDKFPIVALLDGCNEEHSEVAETFTNEGLYEIGGKSSNDLMMLPEKKEGWVNVYKERIYSTKEEAIEATYDGVTYVDTVKVCWEE